VSVSGHPCVVCISGREGVGRQYLRKGRDACLGERRPGRNCQLPPAAEGGGADEAGGGGDAGAARPRQARNKGRTRGTGGSVTAPEVDIAAGAERLADRGEIFGCFLQCRGRLVAGGEIDPAGGWESF